MFVNYQDKMLLIEYSIVHERYWRSLNTLLIIPAYNEEGSIKSTVDSIVKSLPDIDYLIINDGSSDNTADICRANRYPFLNLSTNIGLAGVFQAGMKYADRNQYDCAIQFDADGQHLPEYVPSMVAALKDADIVIGSRNIAGRMNRSMRLIGSNLLRSVIKLTTGMTVTDPTSGMRAYNRRMIELLANNSNMGPEPDTISYLIKSYDAKVIEVPVKMAERTAGKSYLNFWNSCTYMLRMAISILLIQPFRKKQKR